MTILKSTRLVLALIVLSGCAANRRTILADTCVEKVQPMMKFIAMFSAVPEADRKLCTCLAEKMDMNRVDALMLKTGDEQKAAVAALLVENMPTLALCAKETGVVK